VQNLRDYREYVRQRLFIQSPLARGIPGAIAGECPTWQPSPSNFTIDMAIRAECSKFNQFIGLTDSMGVRSQEIEGQSTDGPFVIDLATIPGFPERAVNSIRRAWWDDGSGPVRLYPVILGSLDRVSDTYLAYQPGTPYRFAIESYKFYLMPAPASIGTLKFQAGAGIGGPVDDDDAFDQIPSDYDICILDNAAVWIAKNSPNDVEMTVRARDLAPDAASGLERLSAWFNANVSEEVSPSLIFDARWFHRNRRRR